MNSLLQQLYHVPSFSLKLLGLVPDSRWGIDSAGSASGVNSAVGINGSTARELTDEDEVLQQLQVWRARVTMGVRGCLSSLYYDRIVCVKAWILSDSACCNEGWGGGGAAGGDASVCRPDMACPRDQGFSTQGVRLRRYLIEHMA